jgi:hypothetical protein
MDGPVVTAARKALDAGNIDLVLPFVPEWGEGEVSEAFAKVLPLREGPGREVAGLYFFETVVRVHRAGEGAPYTGLKPAGLSEGPVIPLAEKAIESGSAEELVSHLSALLRDAIDERFRHVMRLQDQADGPVPAAREYVEAMLGFEVYAHTLYSCAIADSREHHGAHAHAE